MAATLKQRITRKNWASRDNSRLVANGMVQLLIKGERIGCAAMDRAWHAASSGHVAKGTARRIQCINPTDVPLDLCLLSGNEHRRSKAIGVRRRAAQAAARTPAAIRKAMEERGIAARPKQTAGAATGSRARAAWASRSEGEDGIQPQEEVPPLLHA